MKCLQKRRRKKNSHMQWWLRWVKWNEKWKKERNYEIIHNVLLLAYDFWKYFFFWIQDVSTAISFKRLLFSIIDSFFWKRYIFIICVCVFGLVWYIQFYHLFIWWWWIWILEKNFFPVSLFVFFQFLFSIEKQHYHHVKIRIYLLNRKEKFFWKWNVPGSFFSGFFSAGLNWINKIHK